MGAFEVVAGSVTNPGAALKALAALTGQSYQVRGTGVTPILQQAWSNNKTGGSLRVRSPQMHDDVEGIRVRVPPENQKLLLPASVREPLYPTDTLTVEESGGEAESEQAALLIHYGQLPGSEGNFQTWAQVQPRVRSYMGVEVAAKSGAAVTEWGAGVALNSSMDQFKRPSEYALLGYLLDKSCTAVAFKGTDIGEVRCGGPGVIEPDLTGDWFIRLAEESGEPAIPVFNSQNVGSILAEVCDVATNATKNITLLCALLG